MLDWSNWDKKKDELKNCLEQAENEIEKMNIIEAKDILVKVVNNIDMVIELANQ